MNLKIVADRVVQSACRTMGSSSKVFLRKRGKPTFDLVEPEGRSRSEVHMKARMTCEPVLDRGRLVRTVVVHHQMDIQIGRYARVDSAQELHKFTAAMTSMQLANHFAGGDIQCREQGSRAMAHVVVGTSLSNARCQRQHGLSAIQRLNFTLLVHAQHHCLKRRILGHLARLRLCCLHR